MAFIGILTFDADYVRCWLRSMLLTFDAAYVRCYLRSMLLWS